jgi:hypothetical protein
MAYKVSAQIVVSSIIDGANSAQEAVELFVREQGFASIADAAEKEGLSVEEYSSSLLIQNLATA